LATRRYAEDGTITLAVDDQLLADNAASFVVGNDGVERTDREAHLRVGVQGLAAVLLGGASWRNLACAGLVRADDPAALAVADRLFAVPEAPHAGFFF